MSQENGVARWSESKKQFEMLETRKPYTMNVE